MTVPPPLSPDEPVRLSTLRRLRVLDTPIEARFERLTRLAQRTFGVKICAVSLVEAGRQWFKSIQGTNACETSREVSFCGHGILESEVFVVEDAREDPRFRDNPLVTGDPFVRFYAGAQIRMPDGTVAGMFCIKHDQPRTLSPDEADTLRDLAGTAALYLDHQARGHAESSLINDTTAAERRGMIDPDSRLWNADGFGLVARQAVVDGSGGGHCPKGTGCAVILVRIDRGGRLGVMPSTARRLLELIRDTDIAGRLDDDTFGVLFIGCVGEQEARAMAGPVIDRLRERPLVDAAGVAVSGAKIRMGMGVMRPDARTTFDDAMTAALDDLESTGAVAA